jgi:hypothetical protein
MTLILFQVIVQSIASALHWIGFYIGVRGLPGDKARQQLWIIGSALVFAAWLFGVVLLAADNFFRNDVLPPRIPTGLVVTLAVGYVFLLSRTFREIIAAIPQHWLIGIQTFRILGGVFLVRYFEGRWQLSKKPVNCANGLIAAKIRWQNGLSRRRPAGSPSRRSATNTSSATARICAPISTASGHWNGSSIPSSATRISARLGAPTSSACSTALRTRTAP